MSELSAILGATRERDYQQQRFFAGLKGIDLDKERGQAKLKEIQSKVDSMNPEQRRERFGNLEPKDVNSDAKMRNPNDILTLSGSAAKKAGFGIGMGLDAEVVDAEGNVTKL